MVGGVWRRGESGGDGNFYWVSVEVKGGRWDGVIRVFFVLGLVLLLIIV